MYQALYRKWRSRTFDEVVGQEHITTILKNQSAENKVSHAYLFCGTRGTGKTSCAKILAKAVNCLSPVNGNPCCECEACKSIDSGSATDVLEIDAASNNGVDNIRDLREELLYPPSLLKKRVYIIDEVHMLSGSAFNALLKTLEEPPEYVIFILATTELNEIPATILSRCQRYEFRRIDDASIEAHINRVASAESISIDPMAASLIAKLADGGMRDALSLLESCTAGNTGKAITPEYVAQQLGVANNDSVAKLYSLIADGNIADSLELIDNLHRSAKNLSSLLDELIGMTRDLLMLKYSPTNFAKTGTYYSGTAEAILKEVAKKCGIEKILYFSTVLEDTQSRMSRYALNKKVLIELAVIRMCDLKLDDSNKALLARIAELEKRPAPAPAPAVFEDIPAPAEEPPIPLTFDPVPAQQKNDVPAEKPEYTEKPKEEEFEFFAEFIEALNTRSDLASFVSKADVKLRGNTLIIRTDFIGHSLLSKPDAVIALNNAVRSATNKNIKIEIKQNNLVQDEFQTSLLDSLGE
ncbi:MAG: DNA polymerase III subunit gamma/tau [Clostridia bacterium]|nr:DNA polymerase III subunit gamma/tau [Clostridia bacterium]MBO7216299.1 DNA polymerase III subunit gamma/tau [Clostridia bacterium]MBO7245340.1 DNA polymerase III subunit gamma/tau [Clostridia bacterium]